MIPKYANRVATILRSYEGSEHENLIDILADLFHWAHENEIDFDDALRIARDHFETEK